MSSISPPQDLAPYAKLDELPQPADTAPPSVRDGSETGTGMSWARADHTHASKVRTARATTAADGTYTWTFAPPFASGIVPRVFCQAVTTAGTTDVVSPQTDGNPTNTSAKVKVNRTQRTVVSLLGLTILSVPTTIGATVIDLVAVEP